MNNRTFDLEERFIDYAVRVINVTEKLPDSKAGKYISNQLVRSGTSLAPNYGEAQSAESVNDFIHKIKVSLKELRESKVWLKIIARKEFIHSNCLNPLINETDELIAILFKSVDTARKNNER